VSEPVTGSPASVVPVEPVEQVADRSLVASGDWSEPALVASALVPALAFRAFRDFFDDLAAFLAFFESMFGPALAEPGSAPEPDVEFGFMDSEPEPEEPTRFSRPANGSRPAGSTGPSKY
jgi:hypothetical protein